MLLSHFCSKPLKFFLDPPLAADEASNGGQLAAAPPSSRPLLPPLAGPCPCYKQPALSSRSSRNKRSDFDTTQIKGEKRTQGSQSVAPLKHTSKGERENLYAEVDLELEGWTRTRAWWWW